MGWKQALTQAMRVEINTEQAAAQWEAEWRTAWWSTTWVLASVPRVEWGEAQTLYVKRTGHSKDHASARRSTGTRFVESGLGTTLPQPRFAIAASRWIGKDGDEAKVQEAIKLLVEAEKDDVHLRAFNQMLTGKPWTKTPEDMTPADEEAVAEKVMGDVTRARRVLRTPRVESTVREASVSNMLERARGGRRATPIDDTPGEPEAAASRTGDAITLAILLDDIRRGLDKIEQMIDSLDAEGIDLVRTFYTDEVLVVVNGHLALPAFTGEALTPEMFNN